jgi:pimeloyl-ACP methyl ester carboxylesterase
MGGDVIVEAARRLRGRVRGLVWVDTYRSLGAPQATAAEFETFVAPFEADFAPAARAFVRSMFRPETDPALVERVVEDMASAPPDIAVGSMRHAMRFEPEACAGLLELRLPGVAINPDDRPTDTESLRRHGMDPIVMPDSSHFLHLENPERFNRLLEQALATFAR